MYSTLHNRALFVLMTVVVCLVLPSRLMAQCPNTPKDGIVANPNRPTVSNPADITQYGVLEVEYGVEADAEAWQLAGLLKYSAARDLELRLDHVPVQHADNDSSFGDAAVGFQYRFLHQNGSIPSMAVAY